MRKNTRVLGKNLVRGGVGNGNRFFPRVLSSTCWEAQDREDGSWNASFSSQIGEHLVLLPKYYYFHMKHLIKQWFSAEGIFASPVTLGNAGGGAAFLARSNQQAAKHPTVCGPPQHRIILGEVFTVLRLRLPVTIQRGEASQFTWKFPSANACQLSTRAPPWCAKQPFFHFRLRRENYRPTC